MYKLFYNFLIEELLVRYFKKSTLSQEISSTSLLKMLPYVKTFTRLFITLPSLVARRSASLVMRNMALVHQNTILCHSLAVAMERH